MNNTPHPQSRTARRDALKSVAAPSMSYMMSDYNYRIISCDPFRLPLYMHEPVKAWFEELGNDNMEEDKSKEVKNHLKNLLLLLFNHLKIIIV